MGDSITISVRYGRKKAKEFEIYIVPNRFTADYYGYYRSAANVAELSAKLNGAETIEEMNKLESEIKSLDLEKVLEDKYNLVKSIMIANEYEYDREWWDEKADPNDIDRLIMECILKDKPDSVKKKLALQANLITKGLS